MELKLGQVHGECWKGHHKVEMTQQIMNYEADNETHYTNDEDRQIAHV